MSLFLQKLKSGGVSIDNNAPPDSAGVIVRKLEKKYVSEPVGNLGLTLSEDAEVLLVAPSSPAAISNIPENYMIFEVNNEFIESKAHFEEVANRNLNLVMRLQSLATMSDLIARILREEESHSKEEVRQILNLDELVRTTPRYNFLSSKHPLFRRYTERLAAKRQATELIKQRTQEAEEQQRRKLRERMRKELEATEAEAKQQAKAELEKTTKKAETAQREPLPDEPFVKSFEDGSFFQKNDTKIVEPEEKKDEPSADMGPEYASELLALIGVAEGAKEETIKSSKECEAQYVILPSEEYILSNGERVICSLKKRIGSLPLPPPGKPPRINKFAKKLQNEKDKNKTSHQEDNKRELRNDYGREGNHSTTRERDRSSKHKQREKDHGRRKRERPRDRKRQRRRHDDSQEKGSRHYRR